MTSHHASKNFPDLDVGRTSWFCFVTLYHKMSVSMTEINSILLLFSRVLCDWLDKLLDRVPSTHTNHKFLPYGYAALYQILPIIIIFTPTIPLPLYTLGYNVLLYSPDTQTLHQHNHFVTHTPELPCLMMCTPVPFNLDILIRCLSQLSCRERMGSRSVVVWVCIIGCHSCNSLTERWDVFRLLSIWAR